MLKSSYRQLNPIFSSLSTFANSHLLFLILFFYITSFNFCSSYPFCLFNLFNSFIHCHCRLFVLYNSYSSDEMDGSNKKTAHQVSHERAELRYQSRLPVWLQQQQLVTDHKTASFIIAESSPQRCAIIRRCTCCCVHFV